MRYLSTFWLAFTLALACLIWSVGWFVFLPLADLTLVLVGRQAYPTELLIFPLSFLYAIVVTFILIFAISRKYLSGPVPADA